MRCLLHSGGSCTATAKPVGAAVLRQHAAGMDIHSPRQLLAAIPHLLWFHPQDGVVVAALDEAQVQLVARYDLDDDPAVDVVCNALRRAQTPGYVVVTYDVPGRDPIAPFREQLRDYTMLDAIAVTAGRWRSYLCQDVDCCPQDGRPLDESVDPLAAALVAAGSAPYPSRLHLERALEPVTLSEDDHARRASAFTALTAHGPTELLHEARQVLRATGPLTWRQVALMCSALVDIRVRDAVLRELYEDAAARLAARGNLIAVLQRAPQDAAASVACVLAGCAWLDGNGAVARMAVDRCREVDPGYSLARLLDRALAHHIPPRVWADSLAAVSVAECLAGAA